MDIAEMSGPFTVSNDHAEAETGSKKQRKKKKLLETLSKRKKETVKPDEGSEIASHHDSQPQEDPGCTKLQDTYTKYVFPFENVVFEGGGNKGLAYCGAIGVLEEIGVMKQITRFGGASAGAMTAALLAVGYHSADIESFLSQNLKRIFLDHSCGYLSLLPNLIRHFGWNPGRRIFNFFDAKLRDATGTENITFMQLYKQTGRELCIVVTNLNQSITEYCHPKTTPDMPIAVAVRMSMAIPGLFMPVRYNMSGWEDVFVDGGILCNYPIHCFDGWWLSMVPEDSFIRRLSPISELCRHFDKSERFGTFNERTLGFLLYDDNAQDVMQYLLDKRDGVRPPEIKPTTKISKQRAHRRVQRVRTLEKTQDLLTCMERFLIVLSQEDLDGDHMISREELRKAIKNYSHYGYPHTDLNIIFGHFTSPDEVFKMLDKDGNGQITYQEIVIFLEQKGLNVHARFLGYFRQEIGSMKDYANSLQASLLLNTKRANIQKRDYERTVGINTDYIATTDFEMEQGDRELLVEQGKRAMISYLDYYVRCKSPAMKNY